MTAVQVRVLISPKLTDFVSVDLASGQLVAAPGEYTVSFGTRETESFGGGYLEVGTVLAV